MESDYSYHFFFSSRRRHTRWPRDWSSDVCSSDLAAGDDHDLAQQHLDRPQRGIVDVEHGVHVGVPVGDRKSTRLNSSHVAISYAVFCLKKKKQKKEQRQHIT